ncbi:MAG: cupin domain-containing protein [Deltaproteobacteria bacterium]|nr:cupin domain-containing protein [Deltaproteobacteria bacterium]
MEEQQEAFVVPLESVPKKVVEAGPGIFIQVLIGPDKAPNFAMRCFTVEPGSRIANHTNLVEHEQYILEGRAEIGVGDKVHAVKQDDVVFIPAGVPHWYRTVGDVAFRFLCLVPNRQDTLTFIAGD